MDQTLLTFPLHSFAILDPRTTHLQDYYFLTFMVQYLCIDSVSLQFMVFPISWYIPQRLHIIQFWLRLDYYYCYYYDDEDDNVLLYTRLLTEREGRTGEYWREVVTVREQG